MEPTFSIIAPIFNELESIPELYRRVKDVMDTTGEPWELIMVDDGSSDGSTTLIRDLARQDQSVRPVIFSRNFGRQDSRLPPGGITAVAKRSLSLMPTCRTHPKSSWT